jgi:hypothetical protein
VANGEWRERQVRQLLAYPAVGPLPAGAIARNIGLQEQEIRPVLDRMVEGGRLIRLAGGGYSLPGAATAPHRGR